MRGEAVGPATGVVAGRDVVEGPSEVGAVDLRMHTIVSLCRPTYRGIRTVGLMNPIVLFPAAIRASFTAVSIAAAAGADADVPATSCTRPFEMTV